MPEIDVGENLDDVKAGFTAVPPGIYLVKVDKIDQVKTKDGTKDMLKTELSIQDKEPRTEANGDTVEVFERKLFTNFLLQSNNLPFLKLFLEAVGVKWEGSRFNPDEAIGATLNVKVDRQPVPGDEDRMSNNVQAYYSVKK